MTYNFRSRSIVGSLIEDDKSNEAFEGSETGDHVSEESDHSEIESDDAQEEENSHTDEEMAEE